MIVSSQVHSFAGKWKMLFRQLEANELLRGGKERDALDLWSVKVPHTHATLTCTRLLFSDLQLKLLRCLHRIFMEPIRCDLNFHYNAMRHRLKERSTLNPNYPSGTCRLPLFWRY